MRELRPDVGVYKIQSKIGSGLTSTVYRAIREDSRGHSKQTVALKILHSQTAVQWLKREFETMTRLNSPFCVKVLAWENSGDSSALVLEHIDGVSLFDLARDRRLPDTLICEILAQAQEGLRAIAKENLRHGDVSPRNILIDIDGNVKLIDFGMPPAEVTHLHGTPAYLAPEIWDGREVTIEAGLFALGMIEMDLRSGFTEAPINLFEAKQRSLSASASGAGWLSLDPQSRQFVELPSAPERRNALGKLVRDFKKRTNPCLATCVADERGFSSQALSQQLKPRRAGLVRQFACHLTSHLEFSVSRVFKQKYRAAALTLFLSLALTAAGQAEAPLREMSAPRAILEIRSSHWMSISIDGVDAGFTPIRQSGLKSGSHRIVWKTATATGERAFAVKPGETLILHGNELVRHSSARQSEK